MLLPENVYALSDNLSSGSTCCNNIDSCTIPELNLSNPYFKVQVELKGWNCCTTVVAMVDCGATALFISKRFVKTNCVHTHPLACPIPLYNIDGSKNKAGSIAWYIHLRL